MFSTQVTTCGRVSTVQFISPMRLLGSWMTSITLAMLMLPSACTVQRRQATMITSTSSWYHIHNTCDSVKHTDGEGQLYLSIISTTSTNLFSRMTKCLDILIKLWKKDIQRRFRRTSLESPFTWMLLWSVPKESVSPTQFYSSRVCWYSLLRHWSHCDCVGFPWQMATKTVLFQYYKDNVAT